MDLGLRRQPGRERVKPLSHVWSPGLLQVTATVTDSSGATASSSHVVIVTPKTCPVPNLVGTKTQNAQKAWGDAGFQTNVDFNPGTGKGNNYTIGHTDDQPNLEPR